MSACVIQQLNLPQELQEIIRSYYYYSKTEHFQRKNKWNLVRQIRCCERLFWKDTGQYYDYFYYKMENWGFFTIEPNIYYITQEISVLSSIFCKECHNYVSCETPIPLCIECRCAVEWLEVD
jgi:hypothetical protein